MSEKIILTCCGFHRSTTSVMAQWIHKSGVTMGNWLMPGGKSNPDGHFEDVPMVTLNDQLLALQGTNWRFHDELKLNNTVAAEQYKLYIQKRDRIHQGMYWGVKDPRLCLFLPEWHQATNGRGRYIIIVRYWKACMQSLLKRDLDSKSPVFESDPKITAMMWYSYNIRLLMFAVANPEKCLIINQSDVDADYRFIEMVNSRFKTHMNTAIPSPFKQSLISNRSSGEVQFSFLVHQDRVLLDALWQRLISFENRSSHDSLLKGMKYSLKDVKGVQAPVSKKQVDANKFFSVLVNQLNSTLCVAEWTELAQSAMFKFEWKVTEEALENLIVNGAPSAAYALLADCKYSLDKKNEAILLYKKGIKMNPKQSICSLMLGHLHMNEGNYDIAKEILVKARIQIANATQSQSYKDR